MTDQPAPTYLAPVQEIDRLRTERDQLADLAEEWRGRYIEKRTDAEGWEAAYDTASADAEAAEKRAKQAEARVDQLTDQLALANDTLRRRATAVNATGATNDTLRALVAQARTWIANCVDPAAVGIEVKRQMLDALSQESASE